MGPDKQSSADESISLNDKGQPLAAAASNKAKTKWWQLHIHWHHFSKRQKIITGSFVSLLVVALLLSIFALGHKANAPGGSYSPPTTVASPLTGIQVKPALAARPVTGIMIENSLDARPQSGLDSAGVVFEAIAEGGITRFMALYQEAQPSYIGPVRSLRPYYLEWARGFDAGIVHFGGSKDALKEARNGSFRNLDLLSIGTYFTRVSSRISPHNVYTSFSKLDQLNRSRGYKSSQFTPWTRKDDAKAHVPKVRTINLTLSGFDFDVSYAYNHTDNTYYRSEGGARHNNVTASGKAERLHPKVVIAMVVPLSQGALDSSNAYYSNYHELGKGQAYIFQDGSVTGAIWHKSSVSSMLTFTTAKGVAIPLDTGQTWITAVASKADVAYHK